MSSYRGTAEGPDRAKAIGAVVAVHVALAAAILAGLNVEMVGRAVERLTTINIAEPPPPPPPPPKPAPKPQQMKKPAGAEAKKAEASPIVAPQPKIPVVSPLPAAKVAGTGSASTSGAGLAGSGTGAGGSGNGTGGGGDYSKFTPARQISGIPNREYRRLTAVSGMVGGTVGLTVRVNPDGSPSNCRIVRTSGNASADSLMCTLVAQYVRFRPALDPGGRAIAQDITWYPRWWRP